MDSTGSGILNSKAVAKGKILSIEEDEDVVVSISSYTKLFKPAGGVLTVILINLSMICFMFTSIGSNYYLQTWCYSDPADQVEYVLFYSSVIIGLAFATGVFIFIRVSL